MTSSVLLLAPLLAAGCLDFSAQSLSPGEAGNPYQPFVADWLDPVRATQWVWVRSRLAGEADGSVATGEEEIVLATIQDGTPEKPGPAQQVILLACRRDGAHPPILLARHRIYDRRQAPIAASFPPSTHFPSQTVDGFTHLDAKISRSAFATRRGLVTVSLWRALDDDAERNLVHHVILDLERDPPRPAPAPRKKRESRPPPPAVRPPPEITKKSRAPLTKAEEAARHVIVRRIAERREAERRATVRREMAAAAERRKTAAEAARLEAEAEAADMREGRVNYRFVPRLTTTGVQHRPVLRILDVDRDGRLDVVMVVKPLPSWRGEIADLREPDWPAIWMGRDGHTFESMTPGARSGLSPAAVRGHAQLKEQWYQAYAEAMAQKQGADRLAYFQYYLGLLHLSEGEGSLADRRLAEAAAGAADKSLGALVDSARQLLP